MFSFTFILVLEAFKIDVGLLSPCVSKSKLSQLLGVDVSVSRMLAS